MEFFCCRQELQDTGMTCNKLFNQQSWNSNQVPEETCVPTLNAAGEESVACWSHCLGGMG